MKERILKFLKNKKAVSITAIILLVIIFIISGNGNKNGFEDIAVERGDVLREVLATGQAQSVSSADLAFERSGKVTFVGAKVGEQVSAGEVLVRLDQAEISAELSRANANLNEELVKLQEIKRTSSGTFSDARISLVERIKDAYVKTDDAIRNNVDQFFKNPRTSTTYLDFSFIDGNTVYTFPLSADMKADISNKRYTLELALQKWNVSLQTIDSAQDLSMFVEETKTVLNQARLFLDDISKAANLLTAPEFQYETTISGYKASIASARTSVGTAITNFNLALEKYNSAPREIENGSFEGVLAQEARVAQFRAQVEAIEAQMEKLVLRSPIAGVVSKQDAKLGEIISPNVNLVSVISAGEMEIEANVSEVNIGKISVGNKASIVFDAFPGQRFSGEIFFIDPAETLVDGVVNYKVKIKLDEPSSEIKSGLTADIRIESERKTDVLRVPQFSVFEKEGGTFVRKLENGDLVEVGVEVGLVGSQGFTEILSGLSEGDMVRFEK